MFLIRVWPRSVCLKLGHLTLFHEQAAVSLAKPPQKPDPEVDDPLYLMTLTIPELFLRPYQVTWDATVFGVFNPDFSFYIEHEDRTSRKSHAVSIQRSEQLQFESKSYIKSWMQRSKHDVYLGAYMNGPDNYLKGIINSALKGLDDAPQLKSKAPTRWIVAKCNRQKGNTECSYYVMHWMSTIILGSFRNNWEAYFNDPRPLEPERLKVLRIKWA
ncbi:hypothetical protein HKD37_19G053197 [Glycine soja]